MQPFFAADVMFVCMNEHDWRKVAEKEIGVSLGRWRSLSGGDFAQSWQATVMSTTDTPTLQVGSKLFIKSHQNPPARHFSTEALGLAWLSDSASVRVPTVLGVSDETPYLALQWVEQGGARSHTDEQLGRELAALHQSPCTHFGRVDKRSTGSLGLPNEPCLVWADFYASQRLLPLARIARDRGALNTATLANIEMLAEQLHNWVSLDETPCRLHGDLWAGNRLVDAHGDSWLIDPACHGGHREFDLAMMRLFGGYDQDCHDAYAESYALSDGWQDRIALHQLAPLIVHAIKFGDSYLEPTRRALALYV